ncbi:hypothetical protein MKW94_022678 [Papaver nudicaule]|uniref:Uncharacterized protein n=1 Tax=Papaver nudicaule TaxID=74823 RepID=A0AA41VUH4_PAPNU|nr:hypothetical protein [Papaver nudicaule]
MDERMEKLLKKFDSLGSRHVSRKKHYDNYPKKPIYPTPKIQKKTNLKASLETLLQVATTCADIWKDVNTKFNDKRCFTRFLQLLQDYGLDWHKYPVSEDNNINVSNQPNRWSSLQASSYDMPHLSPELTSDSNWVMANKFFSKTLSLMRLLKKIREKSSDQFRRDQAESLESFLGPLIMIQQEQRVVACSFFEHLEQLRKADAAFSLASFSKAVDDNDGDRDKCPLILSNHTLDCIMWQQKHLFGSLYIISRESTWLLRKLEDSDITSPSFIEESHKILKIIVDFVSKFKKSKELLDQYLADKRFPSIEEDKRMQLVQENKDILDCFGNHIKDLQEESVGKGSVIESVLGFLGDICKISMDGYGEKISTSSLGAEVTKAVQETIELIKEASTKLNSDRFHTLTGGSPLGNITLWRILFESSLIDLRLDLISKKHGEATKLGVKLLSSEENKYSGLSYRVETGFNMLRSYISSLLSGGNRLLLDFLAMHRTVAEVTYMLGDAFTTGGTGMSDETSSPGTSNKNEKVMEMDFDLDFPWDKHNVADEVEIDLNDPDAWLLDLYTGHKLGPHSDNDYI